MNSSAQGWSSWVWVPSDCFIILSLLSLSHLKDGCGSVTRHRQTHHHAAERAFAEWFFSVTKKPFLETFPFSDFSYISLVRNGSHDLFQTSQSQGEKGLPRLSRNNQYSSPLSHMLEECIVEQTKGRLAWKGGGWVGTWVRQSIKDSICPTDHCTM